MHHFDLIDKKAYAIGVLTEYQTLLMNRAYKQNDQELKDILERVNPAISILSCAWIDEVTFNNQLKEFSLLQNKALALIEKQKNMLKHKDKEIETLKSNIK